MKKKVLSVLLAAVMVAAMLVGCNSGESKKDAGGEAKKGEDLTFVVVPKCVHAWFDEVNKGAQLQADALSEQLGVEVKIDYRAPSKSDVAEQNSVMEQAAATKPDGIAVDPVDYEGSKAVIEEIQSQGIPVVLFDAPSPEGSGLTSVGNDFKGYLNCDACGSGVAAAIEEAGKAGDVTFVAMDNLIEILDYVKSGTISATSSTIPQMQGSMAVLMMWQQSIGIEIPQKVDTGIAYIDETNIDEWIKTVSE